MCALNKSWNKSHWVLATEHIVHVNAVWDEKRKKICRNPLGDFFGSLHLQPVMMVTETAGGEHDPRPREDSGSCGRHRSMTVLIAPHPSSLLSGTQDEPFPRIHCVKYVKDTTPPPCARSPGMSSSKSMSSCPSSSLLRCPGILTSSYPQTL